MIKQLFIKNYQEVDDPKVRNRYGVVSGIFGIVTNFLLFTIKCIIGLLSHSVTIMADAFNNLSDSGSCLLTILGFKLANKPADQKHPYGYARYEYMTGMGVAILILMMGVLFAKSSIDKIFAPEEIMITTSTYLVLIIAILGKVGQMLVYLDFAKSIHSQTIKATAMDARNDILSTSAVLVAMIIMGIFHINIDAYMGLIVSLFIIISAAKMVKETMDPLLGVVPSKEQVKQIKKKILLHPEIKGIHDLVIHNYGVGNDFVTVHAEIPADMDMLVAHDLMDTIEREFKEELGIQLTIHMDPLNLNDQKTQETERKVVQALRAI